MSLSKNMSKKQLEKLQGNAFTATRHKPDDLEVDHAKATNPCLSLHSEDWKVKIKSVANVSSCVCIADLAMHAIEQTFHKDEWHFYHDALSLMTFKDCVDYMKREGIYKHWLLPKCGLNEGTEYSQRPVGNSPEMMPLDCSCFSFLDDALSRHVLFTAALPFDNPNKFSLATTKKE